jgi:hypothetical protein
MQVQGHYDPVQDRILLQLRGAPPVGDAALWLTRRQWTEIAAACGKVRPAVAAQENARGEPRGAPARAAKAGNRTPAEHAAAAAKAALVTAVRFRRAPAGLRIEFATGAPTPLVLVLKAENLASFTDLVERLATKANWDLPAALARLGEAAPVPPAKRTLH